MARDLLSLQKRYNSAYQKANEGKAMRGPGRGPGHRGPMAVRGKGAPKHMKKTVGRLFGYIAPYKFLLILVLFCMAFSTGA